MILWYRKKEEKLFCLKLLCNLSILKSIIKFMKLVEFNRVFKSLKASQSNENTFLYVPFQVVCFRFGMSVRFPLSCTHASSHMFPYSYHFITPFLFVLEGFPLPIPSLPWHLPAAINMKIMCNRRDVKRVLQLTKVSIIWLKGNANEDKNPQLL